MRQKLPGGSEGMFCKHMDLLEHTDKVDDSFC